MDVIYLGNLLRLSAYKNNPVRQYITMCHSQLYTCIQCFQGYFLWYFRLSSLMVFLIKLNPFGYSRPAPSTSTVHVLKSTVTCLW